MKDDFLKLSGHNDLASYFGFNYADLVDIIYKTDPQYKYNQFQVPKKNGGHRTISSPARKLKAIQRKLKDVLYEIYPSKPSAHGFVKEKSIVTNADKHLDKKHIFNLDLEDFFGSIHFGRVRNLFKSHPFEFNHTVSTILAQICCFNNSLPQGAPTSPIISNMIAWKLDSELQQLAKVTNGTYTRYADDISFSFTCSINRIPEDVVIIRDGEGSPGHALSHIIQKNGFNINYDKVRLCSRNSRMEVTGLTVNEFPNVRRRFIKQLSAMIHAWEKYGYEAAEKEHNEEYLQRHRASDSVKSFKYVVKGKLVFLKSVRTYRDPIFIKLASRYNSLVEEKDRLKIVEISDPEKNAKNSLWVIEAYYDSGDDDTPSAQGTGFQLDNYGVVTCAHVVGDIFKKEIYGRIEAYKHEDTTKRYKVEVERVCYHRDVAICKILNSSGELVASDSIEKSDIVVSLGGDVKLLGFPSYAPGHSHYIAECKVAGIYTASAVRKFEIDHSIREGNSGGPVLNSEWKVVGIAVEGAYKEGGHNGCLTIPELDSVAHTDDYLIEGV